MSRKKRNKQFFKEKQLIRLRKMDADINEAIRNQGLVELEEPIHNGYYAEWVLRDDILRRDDAAAYQEALDVCKEKIWSRHPEFKYKDKKTKKWVPINPKLKSINKEKYEALSATAKKFFYETSSSQKSWRFGYSDKVYTCTLSFELVVKISKAFITHRREHDGVLYQMEAENEKIMYRIAGNDNPWGYNNGYGRFYYYNENRKEKLAAERKITDVKKAYKAITHRRDLLDL